MNISNSNIAFLFGSGISIPAGFDCTSQLTQRVLNRKNIIREATIGWTKIENNKEVENRILWDQYIEYGNRVDKLLEIVNAYFSKYFLELNRKMTYEDYYYIIDSLNRDESGDFENPVVNFFSSYLIEKYPELLFPLGRKDGPSIDLISLTSEAKDYIRYSVSYSLDIEPTDIKYLNFIKQLILKKHFSNIHIFTLNHDLLLEKYFDENRIKYSDGFAENIDGKKSWNGYFPKHIKLYKLHGSVDWLATSRKTRYDFKVIKNTKSNNPLMLIGTFNKLSDYSRNIAFELQHLFYSVLKTVNTLIVAGYSFGDQGINSRIINWIYSNSANNIILIHPNPDQLKMNARNAISSEWQQWLNSGILKTIPKYIQEIKLKDIVEKL